MAAPARGISGRVKWRVFFWLGATRLVIVLAVFLIFWLSGWVPVVTAMQISGLLGLVTLGATGYEVFISSEDRPGVGFVVMVPLLMVVCFAIPLWGTSKLGPAVFSAATVGALLALLQLRRHRDESE